MQITTLEREGLLNGKMVDRPSSRLPPRSALAQASVGSYWRARTWDRSHCTTPQPLLELEDHPRRCGAEAQWRYCPPTATRPVVVVADGKRKPRVKRSQV